MQIAPIQLMHKAIKKNTATDVNITFIYSRYCQISATALIIIYHRRHLRLIQAPYTSERLYR